jgi:hypothetical protein
LMFAYLLSRYTQSKALIVMGLFSFIGLYIYDLTNHGFFVYNNLTYTVMSVIFVLYSLYYYYLLLKDDSFVNLRYSPAFWWVAGVLFFYFSTTACNLFNDKLNTIMLTPKHHLSYFIFKALNVILYGCWSYSFICRRWLTTTSKNL